MITKVLITEEWRQKYEHQRKRCDDTMKSQIGILWSPEPSVHADSRTLEQRGGSTWPGLEATECRGLAEIGLLKIKEPLSRVENLSSAFPIIIKIVRFSQKFMNIQELKVCLQWANTCVFLNS